MKLLLIKKEGIQEFFFNHQDAQIIINRCKERNKSWSSQLVGFHINETNDRNHLAIHIKGPDHIIECMEYVDIETNTPEFAINSEFLNQLSPLNEIPPANFESILVEVLTAPVRARRFEVYPEVNQFYKMN